MGSNFPLSLWGFRWSWKHQDFRGFIPVHSWCARLLPWRCHRHHLQQPDRSPCREGGLHLFKATLHKPLSEILSFTVGPGWFSDEHIHPQVPASWRCGPHLSDIIIGCWGDPNSAGTTTTGQTWACTDLSHWDQNLKRDPLSFPPQNLPLLFFLFSCYYLYFTDLCAWLKHPPSITATCCWSDTTADHLIMSLSFSNLTHPSKN